MTETQPPAQARDEPMRAAERELVLACKAATSDAEKVAAIDAYRAALKAQPAPTDPILERANSSGDVSGFTHYDATMSDDEVIAKFMRVPAHTEAAQGSFLVRVTPMNPEYADVHPEIALGDALRVNPYGWPDGFQFEVVAAQGEDSARLDAMIDWFLNNRPRSHFNPLAHITFTTKEMIIAKLDEDRARASAETGGVKS